MGKESFVVKTTRERLQTTVELLSGITLNLDQGRRKEFTFNANKKKSKRDRIHRRNKEFNTKTTKKNWGKY